MAVLKIITIIFDFVLAAIVLYFLSPLKWSSQEDRVSIVGFTFMMGVFLADALLIAFG